MKNKNLLNLIFIVLSLGLGLQVYAHTASNSFLYLNETGKGWEGRIDLAIADLPLGSKWDENQDQWLNWNELKQQWPLIESDLAKKLTWSQLGKSCSQNWISPKLTEHGDGRYIAAGFEVTCPDKGEVILDYQWLFNKNPLHRALVEMKYSSGDSSIAVVTESERTLLLGNDSINSNSVFNEFLQQGMVHLVTGYDHVLFLLTILLPAVFMQKNKRWVAEKSLGESIKDTLWVVSCFTVAHSLTLIPASLGWVSLPSALVETVIAFSVLIAGVNLLYPVFNQYRLQLVCVFGLIHGFGFASVLSELTEGNSNLLVGLLGFNLGIELAQILLVMIFLPMVFLIRNWSLYTKVILPGGGSLVVLVGAIWTLQRIMG